MPSLEMMAFPQSDSLFEETAWDKEEGYKEIMDKSEVECVLKDLVCDVIKYYEEVVLHELDEELWHGGEDLAAEDDEFQVYIPICCKCHEDSISISSRCNSIYENSPDYNEQVSVLNEDEKWICQSCKYDGKHCADCGVSEKLLKIQCDRHVQFISDGAFPSTYYCPECAHSNIPDIPVPYGMTRVTIDDFVGPDVTTCFNCGGDHLPWEIGAPEECREIWNVYGDQFEIDTEEVKDIKASFKEVMDDFFELSEDISEGKYLSIVNKLNTIYQSL
jgi:hypothetical protein